MSHTGLEAGIYPGLRLVDHSALQTCTASRERGIPLGNPVPKLHLIPGLEMPSLQRGTDTIRGKGNRSSQGSQSLKADPSK